MSGLRMLCKGAFLRPPGAIPAAQRLSGALPLSAAAKQPLQAVRCSSAGWRRNLDGAAAGAVATQGPAAGFSTVRETESHGGGRRGGDEEGGKDDPLKLKEPVAAGKAIGAAGDSGGGSGDGSSSGSSGNNSRESSNGSDSDREGDEGGKNQEGEEDLGTNEPRMGFRLVARNLPFEFEQEHCEQLFQNLKADVVQLKTTTDGKSRGMCWLYFVDAVEAEVAYETLNMGITSAGGRIVHVGWSHDNLAAPEGPEAEARRERRHAIRRQRREERAARVPKRGPSEYDNIGAVEKYEMLMAGVPLEQLSLTGKPRGGDADIFERTMTTAERRLQTYMDRLHETMDPPPHWAEDPLGLTDDPSLQEDDEEGWDEEDGAWVEEAETAAAAASGGDDGKVEELMRLQAEAEEDDDIDLDDDEFDEENDREADLAKLDEMARKVRRRMDIAEALAAAEKARAGGDDTEDEEGGDEEEEDAGEGGPTADLVLGDWAETIIDQDRVMKVMSGGNLMRWRALVVAGNNRGVGGFGMGKASDPEDAVAMASRAAKRLHHLIYVDRWKQSTLVHPVMGKHNNCKVYIRPRPPGGGIKASATIRSILTQMGIGAFSAKAVGNRNPYSVVRATFNALTKHRSIEDVALGRGKRILTISRQLQHGGAGRNRAWRPR